MRDGNRFGGTRRLGTLLVGRSDELPDIVLKYEVVERNGDHYVLCRPGDPSRLFTGHVGNFELLGTRMYGKREAFQRSSLRFDASAWKAERERLMDEWDRFPSPAN
jgi:hypothetical protein